MKFGERGKSSRKGFEVLTNGLTNDKVFDLVNKVINLVTGVPGTTDRGTTNRERGQRF
jgi:hypothetical protein